MKTCISCKLEKELTEFPSDGGGKTKPRCKPCHNAFTKDWRENKADKERLRKQWREASRRNSTPEKRRSATLAKYGLTVEGYNELFLQQNGQCKICNKKFDVLHVDHCHTSGRVRGLLCSLCNTGIGSFFDDVDILAAAIVYLKDNDAG